MSNNFFKSALPIWIEGREKEMNVSVKLTYDAKDLKGAKMTLTGAAFYQIFIGDKLIHFGPAKKGLGYTGVDSVPLPDLADGVISVIVAGYYCKCYNGVLIPSFIQAEIEDAHGEILAATGIAGFKCVEYTAKLQKVMRYSFQRQFSECYDYSLADKEAKFVVCDPCLTYIPRGVDLLDLDEKPAAFLKAGAYVLGETLKCPLRMYQSADNVYGRSQFTADQIESSPFAEYLRMVPDYDADVKRGGAGTVEHWDLGKIETGFLTLHVNAKQDSRIIAVFAEQKEADGRPNPIPVDCTNCVEWRLPAGNYELISLEPYTVMGVEVMITDGDVAIDYVGVTECAYSARKIKPYAAKDPELALVYQAAVDTFRHNAVDIYMDCPSRERAGWLCDSYYTSQTEFDFTGKTLVEDEFLNNYRTSGGIREGLNGMLDMCYPSTGDNHIPQWAMWYVLELNDYFTKRGRGDRKDSFKDQLYALLGYFKGFENEFGLLEKLTGWNFVEWSKLNSRVHDVNWATNMLYAETVEIIGKLYDDAALIEKAAALRKTVNSMAWNGKMYMDRAIRQEDGSLKNTDELSETTQYYAFRFGLADINEERCAYLKDMIFNVFGKDIMAEKCPEIEPSNALPGFYIRTELMLKWKMYPELVEYIKHFFLPMAEGTGTLWEHKNKAASCDHGFASYIGVVIKIIEENT
ncbi:MAG: hypothetical protein IJY39_06440 [Clostridia bacterium]|nr:hypothetical protein [Clostridia bacterium]